MSAQHDEAGPDEVVILISRPLLQLILLAVLVGLGLVVWLVRDGRARGWMEETVARGQAEPVPWVSSAGAPAEEVTVPGLGRLPALHVLWRWEQGLGQPAVRDVRGKLAIGSSSRNSGFPLLQLNEDSPPTRKGLVPAEDTYAALLSADGRNAVTVGSGGWRGDGSFAPGPALVYDLQDPGQPRKAGQIALETDAQNFLPWGDYMLLAESRFDPTPLAGSLRVIQLVGPDAGKDVGRLEGETLNLAVEGDRAFTIRICGGKAQPTAPPEALPDTAVQPPPLMMESDPAFPTCLAVIDLAEPSRPTLSSELELPWPTFPEALATHAGFVYMAQFGEGILVADARGPGKPVLLAERAAKDMEWPMLDDNFSAGGQQELVVNGSVLYVGNHTTIAAFDLSDPAAPKPLAAIELGPEGYLHRLILDGDRLFVPTGDHITAPGNEDFDLWVIDAPGAPSALPRLEATRRSASTRSAPTVLPATPPDPPAGERPPG